MRKAVDQKRGGKTDRHKDKRNDGTKESEKKARKEKYIGKILQKGRKGGLTDLPTDRQENP